MANQTRISKFLLSITYPGGRISSLRCSVAKRESFVSRIGGSAAVLPPPVLLPNWLTDKLTMLSHTNSASSCRVGSVRLLVSWSEPSTVPTSIAFADAVEFVTSVEDVAVEEEVDVEEAAGTGWMPLPLMTFGFTSIEWLLLLLMLGVVEHVPELLVLVMFRTCSK